MQTMPRLYRWTRTEYERLAEIGVFEGARVELIGGKIVEMTPIRPRHAALNEGARDAVAAAYANVAVHVRTEKPLALGEWDAPEPDLAVVVGGWRDYLTAHPTAAQTRLVVELADSTQAYDLGDKADVYAAAGIDDYWVVNIPAGVVVVLRAPRPDSASETTVRYGERVEYRAGDQIQPLTGDAQPIAVADLLP